MARSAIRAARITPPRSGARRATRSSTAWRGELWHENGNDVYRFYLADALLDDGLRRAKILAELGLYRMMCQFDKYDPNQPRLLLIAAATGFSPALDCLGDPDLLAWPYSGHVWRPQTDRIHKQLQDPGLVNLSARFDAFTATSIFPEGPRL